jgi:D-aminopeptidase
VVAGFSIGVLVQSNFGGRLTVAGRALDAAPRTPPPAPRGDRDGSCMIVVATDAPLDARNLQRLARRAFAGMARAGAAFANGSGDYAIAFSTAIELRRAPGRDRVGGATLANAAMTPLFVAVADATEEAILNSLLRARTVESASGRAEAVPIERVRALLR